MKSDLVKDHLKEELKDPHFKELYELHQQKLAVVKKIVDYRVKHDLSQGELAQKVGVSQQYISRIETGDFCTVEVLEKVLTAIGYAVRMQVVPLRPRATAHARRHIALQTA
jgi:DNA-binding XRE family transcriptional regulator